MGKTILKVLGGIFAVCCFITAIAAFSQSFLAGLLLMLASVLLFPFAWPLVKRLSGRDVPVWAFVVSGIVLALVGGTAMSTAIIEDAKAQGFSSTSDYQAAKKLGLGAEDYARHQVALAAEERKKQADRAVKEENKQAELAELASQEKIKQAELAALEKKKQDDARLAELSKDADCSADLRCLAEKNNIDAVMACKSAIEGMAKYDYEWTYGFTSPVFKKFAWSDEQKTSIIYFGDEIKMQNGFGNFLRHRYACKYDPRRKSAQDVVLEAGRL